MAKYEVTYSCGHSDTVQLFGKNEERERKLKWMANSLCPECYKKWKQEKDESTVKEALGNIELPALKGTEKQIEYAKSLRDEYIIKDNTPYITSPSNSYVIRLDRFLNHLTSEDMERWENLCNKRKVTQDEWKNGAINSVKKAYACLTEVYAGTLIDKLKSPDIDQWSNYWNERAIYVTPEELLEKYALYLRDDGKFYSDKIKEIEADRNYYAIIMWQEEILALLKERQK